METSTVKYFLRVIIAIHRIANPTRMSIKPTRARVYRWAVIIPKLLPERNSPATMEITITDHRIRIEKLSALTSLDVECFNRARAISEVIQINETT
jgi:hypothetical protein